MISKIAAALSKEKQQDQACKEAQKQRAESELDLHPLVIEISKLDEDGLKTGKETLFSLESIQKTKQKPEKKSGKGKRKSLASFFKGLAGSILAFFLCFPTLNFQAKAQEGEIESNRLTIMLEEIEGKSRENVLFSLIEVGADNELAEPLKESGISLQSEESQDVEADGKTARALFGYLEEKEVEAERKGFNSDSSKNQDNSNADVNANTDTNGNNNANNNSGITGQPEENGSQENTFENSENLNSENLSDPDPNQNGSQSSNYQQSNDLVFDVTGQSQIQSLSDLEQEPEQNSYDSESVELFEANENTQEEPAIAVRSYDLGGLLNSSLQRSDEQGVAVFENLKDAIYLLVVLDQAGYDQIEPLLIRLPQYEASSGTYIRDVTIVPKHAKYTRLTLQKIDAQSHEPIQSAAVFSSYPGLSNKEANQNQTPIETRTTDINGLVSFFLQDRMSIQEDVAPEGYQISNQVIYITVEAGKIYVNGLEVQGNIIPFANLKLEVVDQDPQNPDEQTPAPPADEDSGQNPDSDPSQDLPADSADGTDGDTGLTPTAPTIVGSKTQPSSSSTSPNTAALSHTLLYLSIAAAGLLLLAAVGYIYYRQREKSMGLNIDSQKEKGKENEMGPEQEEKWDELEEYVFKPDYKVSNHPEDSNWKL